MTKLLPRFGGPDAPEQWNRLMKNIVPFVHQKYGLSKDNEKVYSLVVAHCHAVC